MSENEAIEIIKGIADRFYDGHFTIMKFTTNWRISIGDHPQNYDEIQDMVEGSTLSECVEAYLVHNGTGWLVEREDGLVVNAEGGHWTAAVLKNSTVFDSQEAAEAYIKKEGLKARAIRFTDRRS